MKALLTRFMLWCGIVKHPATEERDALIAWHNGPFRTFAREHPDTVAASSLTPHCKWCELYSKHTCPKHGCDKPGIGWYCLLEPDHNGPCRVMRESDAARPPPPPKDRLE